MFVDIAKVFVKAGDGGNGAVSFHREKYVAAGGPDGGDGGRGGNIVFQVDDNLSTLADFRYKRKYIAQRGENGSSGNRTGKNSPDLVIRVPRGTIIRDAQTGRIMADMSGDEPKILAKGGKGGKGNARFATPTRQIPKFAKPGFLGEEYEVTLELKLIADVGLVGFPNVGKSTFINSYAGKACAKTGNKPGVTKGKQWIRLSKNVELLDTPGILWPKFEDQMVGLRLALIGSIKDEILNTDELAIELIKLLLVTYPGVLTERYSLKEENEPVEILYGIAKNRNCLSKGNELDYSKAALLLIDDFRSGKLGKLTLELPA